MSIILSAEVTNSIPTVHNTYIDTLTSVWDKDPHQLQRLLVLEGGITLLNNVEETHYTPASTDQPTSLAEWQSPKFDNITSHVPYGATLSAGDSRTSLILKGPNLELYLRDGHYQKPHVLSSDYIKLSDTGISITLGIMGPSSKRDQLQQTAIDILTNFYKA